MKKLILYLFITHVLGLVLVNAQTITGVVTGADDGQPLPGVNIKVKDSNAATVTDLNGAYSISGLSEQSVLVFSYMGYNTEEITVGTQTKIDVGLAPNIESLDEVVVVGYGVKKKSLVTGAISSVGADDLANTSSTKADQALQGKVSGVQVKSNSGSPGAMTKIRIRGTNSNGNSNPLFIVDGMKTDNINNIDPGDIESMEVLKDAASAAIYGTEGGNGVIIVTTKSGIADKVEVAYDFQYGVQSMRSNMELMDANEYTQWMTEAGNPTSNVDTLVGINTDWMGEVFESAPMQKHHLSVSGGNDKSTYLFSGSYLTQDGIVGGDKANYTRYTARLNAKSEVKKWLEVGENISYAHSQQKYVGEDDEYRGVVNNTLLMDPLTPVVYTTTPYRVQELVDDGNAVVKDENGNYYGLANASQMGEIVNPVALMTTYHNQITIDNILGNAYVTLKPIKGFSFTSRIGIDLTYRNRHFWTPEYYFSTEQSNTMSTVLINTIHGCGKILHHITKLSVNMILLF
jgi:TonB-dependent starch-binding outer membrane protein SusC